MTDHTSPPDPHGPTLSDEDRARAFAATMTHGRASLPPSFFKWALAAIIILGGGGTILERVMGGGTLATTTTSPPVTRTGPPVLQPPLTASLNELIGLKPLGPSPAPPITLTTPNGRPWNLADQRGHVVLVTFYDAQCHDICPVLGRELRTALADLGPRASSVRVAIVNTNPETTSPNPHVAALGVPGLATAAGVTFLTGSLNQLNAVWTSYGVAVSVGARAQQIAHNNVLYFIDAKGRLRSLALPFANESHTGSYSLSALESARFARGIANVASSLIR